MTAANYQPIYDALARLSTVVEGVKEYARIMNEKIQNAGTLEEAQEIAAQFNTESDELAAAIATGTAAAGETPA